VLGPQGIGNHRFSADTSGHGWHDETAGRRTLTPRTMGDVLPRQRLRIPPLQSPRTTRDARTECSWRPDRPRQRPSWVWFEHAGCWGTNLPLTRDSPPIQGDVPGPDPARAPLTRRSPGRGSLVGGSRRGSPLPAKVRQAERRCPGERDVSGPCLGHTRWEPTGTQRSPAVGRSAGRWCHPGNQAPVKSADKERSAGSNAPLVSDTVGGSRSNCEPARVA
jgi:hypothetical protein